MLRKIAYGGFLVAAALLSGCGTMMNGGSQPITAKPSGDAKDVKVRIDKPSGSLETTAPTTISAEPGRDGVKVTVIDKCYQGSTKADQHLDPIFFGNFIWGYLFPIGMGVDFATGRMWDYGSTVVIPVNATNEEGCSYKSAWLMPTPSKFS